MTEARLMILSTTLPDRELAENLARDLVECGFAACAQVGADLVSFYKWQGAVQRGDEIQLVLKVPAQKWKDCAAELKRRHPYDVPQILGWAADRCDEDYLAWAEGRNE